MVRVALLLHLVAFAAFVGAGFAQQRLLAASRAPKLAAAVRDAYERIAAAVVTKIELPAILVAVLSGVTFLVVEPARLREPWMHGKLTAVVLLLVLSHLEMFNARAIVKFRATRGDAAGADIAARKKRHGLFGAVGALLVVAVLVLVTLVR